jgi:hypothetical protein
MTDFNFETFLNTPDAPAATPEQVAAEMIAADGVAVALAKMLRIANERTGGLTDFERQVVFALESHL